MFLTVRPQRIRLSQCGRRRLQIKTKRFRTVWVRFGIGLKQITSAMFVITVLEIRVYETYTLGFVHG